MVVRHEDPGDAARPPGEVMGARLEDDSLGGDTSVAARDCIDAVVGNEGRLTVGSWRLLKAEVALEKKRLLLVVLGAGEGASPPLPGSLLLEREESVPFPFAEAQSSSETLVSTGFSSLRARFDDSRGGVAVVERTEGVGEVGRTRLNSEATPRAGGAAGEVSRERGMCAISSEATVTFGGL